MIRQVLLTALLGLSSMVQAADSQRCVAIAPDQLLEWQANVAVFAQAVSVVPEVDADSGLVAAWRVDTINEQRLGHDLGLRAGDRILALDAVPVHETESFMGRLNELADSGFYSIDLRDAAGRHVTVMVAVADAAVCS